MTEGVVRLGQRVPSVYWGGGLLGMVPTGLSFLVLTVLNLSVRLHTDGGPRLRPPSSHLGPVSKMVSGGPVVSVLHPRPRSSGRRTRRHHSTAPRSQVPHRTRRCEVSEVQG